MSPESMFVPLVLSYPLTCSGGVVDGVFSTNFSTSAPFSRPHSAMGNLLMQSERMAASSFKELWTSFFSTQLNSFSWNGLPSQTLRIHIRWWKMFDSHQSDNLCPLDFVDDILELCVVGGCVCKRWTHGVRCFSGKGFKEGELCYDLNTEFFTDILKIFWHLCFDRKSWTALQKAAAVTSNKRQATRHLIKCKSKQEMILKQCNIQKIAIFPINKDVDSFINILAAVLTISMNILIDEFLF